MKKIITFGVMFSNLLTGEVKANDFPPKSVREVPEFLNTTELPDMGTWRTGQMNTKLRCFDLFCSSKCNLNEKEQKLIVESADKIPNLMTVNKDGKIVFASPKPSATIRTPKGHPGWIRIELTKVTPQTSKIEKYLCLGVKKNNEHLTQLYKPSYAEEYVGVDDNDVVELVPMLSKTDLTNGYTSALAGEEVNFEGFDISQMASFDFGSVYKISLDFVPYTGDMLWLERECDLTEIEKEDVWDSIGSLGIGSIKGKANQLVISSKNGKVSSSSDGTHWNNFADLGVKFTNIDVGGTGLKYGNDRWGIISFSGGVDMFGYSADEFKSWQKISRPSVGGIRCFAFGNAMFMYIHMSHASWVSGTNVASVPNAVYSSTDAVNWTKSGQISTSYCSEVIRSLCYGNGKWLAVGGDGYSFSSENGKDWVALGNQLASIGSPEWYGGTFAHGYFYVINEHGGIVARSSDGKKWDPVTEPKDDMYRNITFCKNKLYMINNTGTRCNIGLFWPSNLID